MDSNNNQQNEAKKLEIKNFSYEIVSSYPSKGHSYAMAFNHDCSLLIAGFESQIHIYEHKEGVLIQKQILREHLYQVNTLKFFEKSNLFISSSSESVIIIWSIDSNNQWIPQQKLLGHTIQINCLELNQNEDLIVSGAYDKTIKFWEKQNQWICQQTISNQCGAVYQLSFNDSQNQLICCSDDPLILILQMSQNDQQWIVFQKIKLDQIGYRLCFIDDYLFTIQLTQGKLQFFESDQEIKTFKLKTELKLKSDSPQDQNIFFPLQYIKTKRLLVSKNYQNVHLIRIMENYQFHPVQSIQYDGTAIFGCLSKDGEYLITFDGEIDMYNNKQVGSYQLKIRKVKDL